MIGSPVRNVVNVDFTITYSFPTWINILVKKICANKECVKWAMIIVLPEILDRICYKLRLCSLLLESLPHFRLSTQRKVFHSWHSFYNTLHGLQLRLVSNFCFDNPSTFKKIYIFNTQTDFFIYRQNHIHCKLIRYLLLPRLFFLLQQSWNRNSFSANFSKPTFFWYAFCCLLLKFTNYIRVFQNFHNFR